MSIPTIYVPSAKKWANKCLADKGFIVGTVYDLYGSRVCNLSDMPSGTVVKFYKKLVQGTPYASAYGVWEKEKNRIK